MYQLCQMTFESYRFFWWEACLKHICQNWSFVLWKVVWPNGHGVSLTPRRFPVRSRARLFFVQLSAISMYRLHSLFWSLIKSCSSMCGLCQTWRFRQTSVQKQHWPRPKADKLHIVSTGIACEGTLPLIATWAPSLSNWSKDWTEGFIGRF